MRDQREYKDGKMDIEREQQGIPQAAKDLGIDPANNSWVKRYTDGQLKSIIKAAKGELVHRMKEL